MIRIGALRVPLDTQQEDWSSLAAKALCLPVEKITACQLAKRSIDARKKDDIRLVLTLDVEVDGDEAAILRKSRNKAATQVKPYAPPAYHRWAKPPARRPVVIGCGPAGLFAAWTLAQAGAMPILLERGRDAQTRHRDVERFWQTGALDPRSNVQFGEGGAGTFSDGKLNTGIKDARCRAVLETFVAHGAPESILWQAKPHIGTDYLRQVVQRMRKAIEALGGTVRFEALVDGLLIEDGRIRGVRMGDETVETDAVILAIGHSARDTVSMLQRSGVQMSRKPFSIGVRIEHTQAWLDRAQYGRHAGHPALGAATYKLATHLPDGRGVYTFCMCPGGTVVAAASELDGVVTNGMSVYARDATNANSALLVEVRPEDLAGEDVLAGFAFQRRWEQMAFEAGESTYKAPAQRVEDFLASRPSTAFGSIIPSYRPGVMPRNLRDCLPDFVAQSLAAALPRLDNQLRGFAAPDAVLTGVETRSSSPVRILRDERRMANLRGLYPAGEGAGYAGGIMSAAVDGIRCAEEALRDLLDMDCVR